MKKTKKSLVLAVTVGILAGASYIPSAFATDYSAVITGKDPSAYSGIYQEIDRSHSIYDFGEGADVTVNGSGAKGTPVKIKEGMEEVTVKAQNGVLNFSNKINNMGDEFGGSVTGVYDDRDGTLNFNAKNINITAVNVDEFAGTKGIYIKGNGRSGPAIVNAHGNMSVISKAGNGNGNASNAYGIIGEGRADITIDGNLTMKEQDGSWGIDAGNLDYFKVVGIKVAVNNDTGTAATGKVKVTGDVDLKVNGTAIFAAGEKGLVDINGGGNLEVNKDGRGYAIVVNGGSNVNINVDTAKAAPANNDLVIKGNIGTVKEWSWDTDLDSEINVGLASNKSSFTGIVDNNYKDASKGRTNIYLQNGAVWNNEQYGSTKNAFKGSVVAKLVGSAEVANAGYIVQKDVHDLTINNYSGNTVLFYEHEGNGTEAANYKAGNTKINSAAQGSAIIVSTGNNDIAIDDKDQVNKVLTTLAGKLFYTGAISDKENNLTGKVQIASGLTASSAAQIIKDITFDKTTGQGAYKVSEEPKPVVPPNHQTGTDFNQTITGDKDKDTVYVDNGVLKQNNKYIFEKDSKVNVSDFAVNSNKSITIEAKNNTLDLNVSAKNNDGKGIWITTPEGFGGSFMNSIEAKKLNIGVDSNASAVGVGFLNDSYSRGFLFLKGDVAVNAEGVGDNLTAGIYSIANSSINIDGNVSMEKNGSWGIVGKDYTTPGYSTVVGIMAKNMNGFGGKIAINGDVNLKVQGTGVTTYGNDTQITINGGNIVTDATMANAYSLASAGGTISMNVPTYSESAGNGTVKLAGNIGFYSGDVDNPAYESIINLGLGNEKSSLTGVIYKDNKVKNANLNLY